LDKTWEGLLAGGEKAFSGDHPDYVDRKKKEKKVTSDRSEGQTLIKRNQWKKKTLTGGQLEISSRIEGGTQTQEGEKKKAYLSKNNLSSTTHVGPLETCCLDGRHGRKRENNTAGEGKGVGV